MNLFYHFLSYIHGFSRGAALGVEGERVAPERAN